ncbi:MAG: hypothetical protein ACRBFS_06140, partial [Aureispira sp.]
DADLRSAKLISADLSDANLYLSKTNDPNFFQTLQQQHCIGIEELIKKYEIDPTLHYEDWDTAKKSPYYFIKER